MRLTCDIVVPVPVLVRVTGDLNQGVLTVDKWETITDMVSDPSKTEMATGIQAALKRDGWLVAEPEEYDGWGDSEDVLVDQVRFNGTIYTAEG